MQNIINKSCIGSKIREEPIFLTSQATALAKERDDRHLGYRVKSVVNKRCVYPFKFSNIYLKMESVPNVGASTSSGKGIEYL